MRHLLWVALSAGALAACTDGSNLDTSGLTGNPSVSGSPSQVYTPPEPGTATDVVLQLSWQPNTDPVAGYRVYFGATADSATNQLSDLATANRALSSQAPSVTYNAGRDLGLNPGSQACFRLRAYNADGVLSDWSQPTCAAI